METPIVSNHTTDDDAITPQLAALDQSIHTVEQDITQAKHELEDAIASFNYANMGGARARRETRARDAYTRLRNTRTKLRLQRWWLATKLRWRRATRHH